MVKVKYLLNNILLNKVLFLVIYIIAVMTITIPYLHTITGSYIKYLLVWGLVLVVYDIFRTRGRVMLNKYIIMLMLFCGAYGVTILHIHGRAMAQSINALAYMIMTFLVLFADVEEDRSKKQKRQNATYITVIICTFIMSLACFVTFVLGINIKYKVYDTKVYIGMYQNRLWGLYNPNVGATLAVISIVLTVFSIGVICNKKWNVFAKINIVLQYFIIVLTMSRTATYSTIIVLAIFVMISLPMLVSKIKSIETNRIWVRVVAGILAAVIAFTVIRCGEYAFTGVKAITANASSVSTRRADTDSESVGGILNGRQYIWKAGVKVFKRSPIIGVTKESIYRYGRKNIETLTHRRAFRTGGLHNIYLTILVASGVVGFLIMSVFAIFAIKDVFKRSKTIKAIQENQWYIAGVFLIGTILCMEFFEARILYELNIHFLIFWMIASDVLSAHRNEDVNGYNKKIRSKK